MTSCIDDIQSLLVTDGVIAWSPFNSPDLGKRPFLFTDKQLLATNRVANNLSASDSIRILQSLLSLRLDTVLCSYFMSEWMVLGVQQISATNLAKPQQYHRDHHLPAKNVVVLAFTLEPNTELSTLFCLGSHHEHRRKVGMILLEKYPPQNLATNCILYDSATVHAGNNHPEALQSNRLFITFISTDIPVRDQTLVSKLNGIKSPLNLHRREFFPISE